MARRQKGSHLRLLLLFTLLVLVGFAFPRLIWATHLGYSLIALLLTQVMVRDSQAPDWSDRIYRGLGLFAVLTMWLWLITPLELIYSGVPLALSWSVLVGWSVIRLVKRFADEPKVTESLLMGATAGYLHIGLTAGLVMSALETIQPGSFEPLTVAQAGITACWQQPMPFRRSTTTPLCVSPPWASATSIRCCRCREW